MYRNRLTSEEIAKNYYDRKHKTLYDRLFAAKHDSVKDMVIRNEIAGFNAWMRASSHTYNFEQKNKDSRRAQIV